MLVKTTALLMKSFIERKEFFLYPYGSIEAITDIVLHKQLWFKEFFIEFIDDPEFLQSPLEHQKNRIYPSIKEIQLRNRYKKLFFYKILLVEQIEHEEQLNQLKELHQWISEEKVNFHLIVLDLSTLQVIYHQSNFEDDENILPSIQTWLPQVPVENLDSIDLLDIERTTKQTKGYFFPKKRFYFTNVLLAINVLIFIYMSITGSTTDSEYLIAFGAKYNPLIAAGEYYRLFTSMFLHIGSPHLMFNSYALYMLGKDVEAIYGTFKFLIIYVLAGLFGSLGSFLFSHAVSAGASGAIFGLIGAYMYFGVRRPAIFSARYGLNLVSMLVINIIFGLTVPGIDNFAHLGGFLGGYLSSWALGLHKEKLLQKKHIVPQMLIMLLIVGSLLTGVKIQQSTWEYYWYKGVKELQQDHITEGQSYLEKGVSLNPEVGEFYYNLAYVHYRKGDIPTAIEYLNQAISLDPKDDKAQEFLQELIRIQQ
ncbi:rhomboid protease GluP [Anaerosolibacter carboniphilus]|uniref:Rhomboid protease GluP n=1 Tax=Anaerosolibacter carboniphilus TaxID=1417629 RepID=A0A841L552_9FIRM|nr:rhomboid family intramembrane serine protease [Anaerosolibacter carboniphilus]MBB6218242.1 rhomboid protease GluP [Anaerosolibacter carboniphilus]